MILDLLLKGGKIVTPQGIFDGDIGIRTGKIESVGAISAASAATKDISGLFVLPGLIDMHVHFRDPGDPQKEDFASGSAAAAAGGVTTVIDMPNTSPATLTCEALEEKRRIAVQKSIVNFGFYMGLGRDNLEEIRQAKNIAGVKVYLGSTTGDLLTLDLRALEKLFELGKFVVVHAEDENIIRERAAKYKDTFDPSVHSIIRSPEAAYEAVKKILHLAKKSAARIHITHVSTKEEADELKKFRGQNVSADVTPHHLFLTQSAYAERANFVKMNPPLRTNSDRKALWQALREDVIQAVASDHAPHTKAEKERQYQQAPAGVPGLETMLPLLLDAVNHGELTMRDVVRLTSENPARLLGLKSKGRIEAGYDADIVVVDAVREMEVGRHGGPNSGYFTKCGWSPFSGWKLKGWPVMTIVGGQAVFENGKITGGNIGQEVVFSP